MATTPITDVQLSQLYVCATGTAVTTPAEIAAAIAAGKQIAAIQDFGGDIEESLNVTEYKIIDSNLTTKAFGTSSLGNISPVLLFEADNATGQDEMRTLFTNRTKSVYIIKLTDDGLVSPSYITWDGGISMRGISLPVDGAVLQKFTIEFLSPYNLVEKTDI